MKIKKKTCRICKCKHIPIRILQPVCDKYECKVAYAIAVAEKAATARKKREARETKVKLDKLKTRQEYLKDAQRFFNHYIRVRDKHLPCISCQRFHTGQYHAGHLRSVGASPHMRFNEDNVHKQCSACNNHLSGNILNFRINLINKIGYERVEAVENDNEPKHYTIPEIIAIKTKYKLLIKEMKDAKTPD